MARALLFIFAALASGCTLTPKEQYVFVDQDSAEITFETNAPNWSVDVYISTSNTDCQGFKHAGELFYDAQLRGGGVFGALQKINPLRKDENLKIEHRIPSQSAVQIQVFASQNVGNSYGSCGPLTAKINAVDSGQRFKAHIDLANRQCTLKITDVVRNTSAGKPLFCKK